jgi:hypothetical protein
LEELPNGLIRLILRLANIGELIISEHEFLLQKKGTCSLSSVWIDKFWKLSMSIDPNTFFERPESIIYAHSDEFAKELCTEYFVSQSLLRLSKEPIDTQILAKVLQYHGNYIRNLNIYLDSYSMNLAQEFWESILQICPKISNVRIYCEQANKTLGIILGCLAKRNCNITIIFKVLSLSPTILKKLEILSEMPKLPLPFGSSGKGQKYIKIPNETDFKLRGVSSLAEYLDRPPAELEKSHGHHVQQRTPINMIIRPSNMLGIYHDISNMKTEFISPYITDLSLENIDLTLNIAELLSSILLKTTTITKFSLVSDRIDNGSMAPLLQAMSENKWLLQNMQEFKLSRLLLNETDSKDVCKYLGSKLVLFEKLAIFEYSFCPSSSLGTKQLLEGILKSNVKSLNLSGMDVHLVLKSITMWTNTRKGCELTLANCNLIPRHIQLLSEELSVNIRKLNISGCTFDERVIEEFGSFLGLSSVNELNLSDSKGIGSTIIPHLEKAKELQTLALNNSNLSDEFFLILSSRFDREKLVKLKHWDFMNNSMTDTGLLRLKKSWTSVWNKFRSSTRMRISGNQYSENALAEIRKRTERHGFEGLFLLCGKHS